MDRRILTIDEHYEIAEDAWFMKLRGRCGDIEKPGQFINIKLQSRFLRRPISIFDHGASWVSIIYKALGSGTREMTQMNPGDTLDVLLPLGNGFDVEKCTEHTVLVGGGIGMPPMHGVAKELVRRGIKPSVVLGFNSKREVLPTKSFEKLGIKPIITTVDGSAGKKGLVTDAMEELRYDYVCACGPEPMLKAVYEIIPDGQLSFEERMGCGFGACMGCSCKTKYGYKRICTDGPVLNKEEIIW